MTRFVDYADRYRQLGRAARAGVSHGLALEGLAAHEAWPDTDQHTR